MVRNVQTTKGVYFWSPETAAALGMQVLRAIHLPSSRRVEASAEKVVVSPAGTFQATPLAPSDRIGVLGRNPEGCHHWRSARRRDL